MGLAEKVVKGTAIVAGGATLIVGVAAYNAGKYVKRLIYPPTFKKYIALGAIPFVLYSVKNPSSVVHGVSNVLSGVKHYASRSIEKMHDEHNARLSKEIEQLKSQNASLEGIIKKKGVEDEKKQKQEYTKDKSFQLPAVLSQSPIGKNSPKAVSSSDIPVDFIHSKYFDLFAPNYWQAIFVDAKENRLYLLESNGRFFYKVAEYLCTTGKNPFPKSKEGDFATPQGIFFLQKESLPGWKTGFSDDFMRIKIPKEIGSGILIAGSNRSDLLLAIEKSQDATYGGIILSASDFENLNARINRLQGENIPVGIRVTGQGELMNYSRERF